MTHKVILTYYKGSGKYYSEAAYESNKEHLFQIWAEVEDMVRAGNAPGLSSGGKYFIVQVDVPTHHQRHPHLVNIQPAVNYWNES